MEIDQNQTQADQADVYRTLKDIPDEELLQIYKKSLYSYQETAYFIKAYYEIETSRQAVYKRLKPYMLKKTGLEMDIKEKALKVLLDAITQNQDTKLRLSAAKIILRNY